MQGLGATEPRRIGGYRLLGRLGTGGMGDVYLARSDRGRTVAVKLVREELAVQEEFRARFRYEVEAARRVGGRWTAPVLDADTEAAVPWVATGYVAGPSLRQVVGRDHGPLPERSVRALAAGLAHALRDIHGTGLVHRDLKPSNVLVTLDGPMVIDFGIARALDAGTDGRVTRTGALVGSPGFMAPEQVRGDRITPACDIFCLGSVLAYAATGKVPFGTGTAQTDFHVLMYRIAYEEPDLEGVPESLAHLIRACLDKNPAARPSPGEVLRRAGARDTVADAGSKEPWLPAPLVAQLGRHAVSLLNAEDPQPPEPAPPRDPPPGQASAPEATPVAGVPPTPAAPLDAEPASPRRGRYAMLIISLIVALSAGGVISTLTGGEDGHRTGGAPSDTATPPAGARPGDGVVPAAFLGTWTTSVRKNGGPNPRLMTIRQGDVGDTVLHLVTDGPRKDGGGTYHCEFVGSLGETPDSSDAVRFGPTAAIVAEPAADCPRGESSTLTLLSDGTLRRVTDHSGGGLTWTRR
ncbi:serine/threonine-protein kinase [Streptomyces tremellae]|uniref:Protein kinase domain-containing protein n=1 Tax=Streptomyces tremellae TaxID=1124239 RepID=A0ABP7FV62_9ACTN